MKKQILFLGVVALLMIMLITLTGCGNSTSTDNDESKSSSEDSKASEELYPVEDEDTGNYGYVNNKGQWVIEPKYISAYGFDPETGLAEVKTSRDSFATGFINKEGELVIEDKYGTGTHSFKNGYAVVETDIVGEASGTYNSLMLIDKDGNVIIESGKYIRMTDVSKSGLLGVVESSGMKYINLDGTVVIDKKFGSHGTEFNDKGIACVEDGLLTNNYIVIDEQGNQVGEGQIDLNNNNYGFITNSSEYKAITNETGKALSDYIYFVTSDFNDDNVAMVVEEPSSPYFLIDVEGNKINDETYETYSLLPDGKWVVTLEDGKHQVLNADGSILVDTF